MRPDTPPRARRRGRRAAVRSRWWRAAGRFVVQRVVCFMSVPNARRGWDGIFCLLDGWPCRRRGSGACLTHLRIRSLDVVSRVFRLRRPGFSSFPTQFLRPADSFRASCGRGVSPTCGGSVPLLAAVVPRTGTGRVSTMGRTGVRDFASGMGSTGGFLVHRSSRPHRTASRKAR
jgi:hypothetical protein